MLVVTLVYVYVVILGVAPRARIESMDGGGIRGSSGGNGCGALDSTSPTNGRHGDPLAGEELFEMSPALK